MPSLIRCAPREHALGALPHALVAWCRELRCGEPLVDRLQQPCPKSRVDLVRPINGGPGNLALPRCAPRSPSSAALRLCARIYMPDPGSFSV